MRVAMFDLETTSLQALMGRILCCSFQEVVPKGYSRNHHGTPPGPYTYRIDREPWKGRDLIDDRRLAVAIRDELETYHLIVGWNSKMFDVPFLNARLLYYGERPLAPQFHADLMYYAGGNSNRIGSRKLVNVQKFLHLTESKTEIDWETWQRAGMGDAKALKEVVFHCEADVKVTAEVYWALLPYIARLHK